MATVTSMLQMKNEELLLTSMQMVDKASNNALKHCFEDLFKGSVMKYLLKIIIPQEIKTLSHASKSDWKKVSLIQKISTLHETSEASNTNTVSVFKKQKEAISRMIDHTSSTHYLLTIGFIKDKMMNENTSNLPNDIVILCQQYIGSSAYNPLMLFHYDQHTYYHVSQTLEHKSLHQTATKAQTFSKFLHKPISKSQQLKLVKPNAMLLFDSQKANAIYCDALTPVINCTNVSVNLQSNFKTELTVVTPPSINTPTSIPEEKISGALQYVDTKRLQLLQFGGITTPSSSLMYGGMTSFLPQRKYHNHDSILRYMLDNDAYDSANNWTEAGHLIHARGYMSLCAMNEHQLSIIGGQQLKTHTTHIQQLRSVELFDLSGEKSNVMLNSMHFCRSQSGSLYNHKTNNLIVFGGNTGNNIAPFSQYPFLRNMNNDNNETDSKVSQSMEIYDFHKDAWFDVQSTSNLEYKEYPCIWTIGAQCVFVSKVVNLYPNKISIESEWIDLRVCDKSGINAAKFNTMNTINVARKSHPQIQQYELDDKLDCEQNSNTFSMFVYHPS